MRRILACILLLLCAFLGWQAFRAPAPQAPSSTSIQYEPRFLFSAPIETWDLWGGATHSVSQDGIGFFDSARADRFIAAYPKEQHRYIIHLVSRAFLPEPGIAAFDGRADSEQVLAYLQLHEVPDAAERAALAAEGIALERYVAGLSWRVQASLATLRRLATRASVRSVTEVDPRDKLHPSFWFEKAPAYARQNGLVSISVLARPGPNAVELTVAANPVEAVPGTPSILGDRFLFRFSEKELDASPLGYRTAALALARSVDVLYVEPPAPPLAARDTAGSRDVTTDDSSNISDVRDNGPLLTGSGVVVAVREIGRPDAHIDFSSRLTEVETDGATDASNRNHATQVHGQVGGLGFNNPSAKGVAPGVALLSYSVGNSAPFSTADVTDAKNRNARISNHSYGPTGSSLRFGTYETVSADWDAALRTNDQLGLFAGAEVRNEPQPFFKQDYFVGAKNTILISSTNSTAHAGDTVPPRAQANGLADFSLFGPMNDGRIKPDLMAFGDGVSLTTGPNGESVNFGTSFSTPAASGVAALLLQHYRKVTSSEPSAAMLKALLCNTASDLGNPGPDVQYGFGIVNAEAAVNLVSLGSNPTFAPFRESTIGGLTSNGNQITVPIQVDSPLQLRATLCWFDPPGDPAAAKALVNDLDLALIAPNGQTFFPFSIDKNNPQNNATALAPNTVDPIEQLVVDANQTGTWFVRISGFLPTGSQNFAVVFNRPPTTLPVTADILASPTRGVAPLLVSFQAGSFDLGGNAVYSWNFGDGGVASGFTVSHTYTSPGEYLVTLTVTANGETKTDTETIIVDRRGVTTFAKKITLSMKYTTPEAPDDALQFYTVIPELVRTAQQAREAVRDGTFEGVRYRIFVNNTLLSTALLNRKATYKDTTLNFKLNLRRGEVSAKFKKKALDTVLGLNAAAKPENLTSVSIRLENDDTIYSTTLPVQYIPGKNRGKGKTPRN